MAGCLFFFQAEDGIRDPLVTGVQTCALPISRAHQSELHGEPEEARHRADVAGQPAQALARSEERRVGKEGRSRRPPRPYKTKPTYEGAAPAVVLPSDKACPGNRRTAVAYGPG